MSRGRDDQAYVEFQGAVPHASKGTQGATITPDANDREAIVYTMGAATTVAAPANSSSQPIGTKLYLVLVQDATAGRTLTWNATYRNAPSGLGGSATNGQRASFEFRYDGASWQYTGGSTAFA